MENVTSLEQLQVNLIRAIGDHVNLMVSVFQELIVIVVLVVLVLLQRVVQAVNVVIEDMVELLQVNV
jgi:hypothetical protein